MASERMSVLHFPSRPLMVAPLNTSGRPCVACHTPVLTPTLQPIFAATYLPRIQFIGILNNVSSMFVHHSPLLRNLMIILIA